MTERNGRIFAVFGLSGVGKTTMCAAVAERIQPAALHVQVGKLLGSILNEPSTEALRTASSDDVLQNQMLLPAAMADMLAHHPGRHAIFDGHSLIDTGKSIVIVPANVITAMRPSGIAFIYDDPKAIHDRRKTDTTRKRPLPLISEISEQQNLARAAAEQYATEANTLFFAIPSGDIEALFSAISFAIET